MIKKAFSCLLLVLPPAHQRHVKSFNSGKISALTDSRRISRLLPSLALIGITGAWAIFYTASTES